MAKKLNLIISADNSQVVKAFSELQVSLAKANASFRSINASQKAAEKNRAKGSGGLLDPKELNAVGTHLNDINGFVKNLTLSQNQWERNAGFKGLKSGFDSVSDSAGFLYKTVSALLSPILTLTGAGVIDGLKSMADSFGKRSTQVMTSQFETGFSPKSIYKLQNLGQAAGIDPDTTSSWLTQYTQTVRDMALNANNGLLGTVQNQLGVKDIYKRYNDPKQRDPLLWEMFNKARDVSLTNPSAGFALRNELGLQGAEPLMMLSPEQRNAAEIAAKGAFVPTNSQINSGREEDLARARLKLSSGSFMSKVGAHLSPYMTDFYNNVSDTFSGKFTPEKGLAGLDLIYFGDKNTPDPFRDWMRSKWKKYFASPIDKNPMGDWKGDPGQDPMGDFIPSVKSGGDPSGISVSGSAPKDQTITLDINISGAPKGTTVTVPPNQPVKVRPTINHMGFDQ